MAACLRRWALAAVLGLAVAIASGCGAIGYYAQAVHGHLALLAAARPIEAWLQDPTTPEDLKDRLRRAQAIRAFASRELALPENASYTAYADLQRPAAVWNVFAAPELSLQLKTWCYPVLGCAGYRGYFAREAAEREAAALRAQGYEVAVAPVPAYSTLGWFDDPLLNTFIRSGEGELARLIFHELAHQVAYAKDDTVFNESFATLVEQVGLQRWLSNADAGVRAAYAQQQARRADFVALLLRHRRALAALYDDASLDAAAKRQRKAEIFAALRADYARIKAERWGGFDGYDAYFAQELNNAHLAAVGAYHDLVPAFEALLQASGGNLPRFYARVRELARAPRAQRHAALQQALARR